MDRGVTYRAILISQYGLVMERGHVGRELIGYAAVTFQAQLANAAPF